MFSANWRFSAHWNSAVVALSFAATAALSGCGDRSPSPAETVQGLPESERPAPGAGAGQGCDQLPSAKQLGEWLRSVPGESEAGGLFSGRLEWAAVVNRNGEVCAVAAATDDPAAVWPGGRAIAMAKAYTANAFSTDMAPLSTARLYTLSQPGHSLWGASAGNPFNPQCLAAPGGVIDKKTVCGGTIVFGGGVPLYRSQTRVGGLGVSGDTACADHEIAKRIRTAANLNPPGGAFADDIRYSSIDAPTLYTHPLCANTWRNGTKIGEEPVEGNY